jgi:hypothetical protein
MPDSCKPDCHDVQREPRWLCRHVNPNAYYIQAGAGTLPNGSRNTLPTRPVNNWDLSILKRLTFHEYYSFEFGAGAYNVFNHAQYTPGTVNNINSTSNNHLH